MKEAFGEEVGEKADSYWRAYMESLAERNGRPSILEVLWRTGALKQLRLKMGGRSLFIDPVNKKSNQQIVQTWAKKGSLLTLTFSQAVRCGIADKLVSTREELLGELNAYSAEVAMDEDLSEVIWVTSEMANNNFIYSLFLQICVKMGNICKFNIG